MFCFVLLNCFDVRFSLCRRIRNKLDDSSIFACEYNYFYHSFCPLSFAVLICILVWSSNTSACCMAHCFRKCCVKMATASRDGEGTFKMVAKAFKMAARALGLEEGLMWYMSAKCYCWYQHIMSKLRPSLAVLCLCANVYVCWVVWVCALVCVSLHSYSPSFKSECCWTWQ